MTKGPDLHHAQQSLTHLIQSWTKANTDMQRAKKDTPAPQYCDNSKDPSQLIWVFWSFLTALVSFCYKPNTLGSLVLNFIVLCSLVLGVISRGVNKVPFNVSHVAFDVSSLCWEYRWCCYSSLCIFPCILCQTCSNVQRFWFVKFDLHVYVYFC